MRIFSLIWAWVIRFKKIKILYPQTHLNSYGSYTLYCTISSNFEILKNENQKIQKKFAFALQLIP